MSILSRTIAGVASLLMIIVIAELVRRRRLREEYSLLWLAAGIVIFLMAVEARFLNWLAALMKIDHPAYALFVVAGFVGMVLAIHFTIVLSKLTAQNWRLTQEIGLLRAELDELQAGQHSDSIISDPAGAS